MIEELRDKVEEIIAVIENIPNEDLIVIEELAQQLYDEIDSLVE